MVVVSSYNFWASLSAVYAYRATVTALSWSILLIDWLFSAMEEKSRVNSVSRYYTLLTLILRYGRLPYMVTSIFVQSKARLLLTKTSAESISLTVWVSRSVELR